MRLCAPARGRALELSVGEAIRRSELIVELPELASADDCEALVATACGLARDAERDRFRSGLDPSGRVRIPTIAAARRCTDAGVRCAPPLPYGADGTAERLLLRALGLIDEELPSIVQVLFGNEAGRSLTELYDADLLEFSSREPACNVYTAGGEFLPHKDHQSLTVLIPLTSPSGFKGGGTGFWHPDARGPRVEEPSVVLTPAAGTALVFGGHLNHCGVAVEEGTRVVYVASFSLAGGREQRAAEAAESRDLYGDLL